ncbi:thiamine phosphate synthase [Paremcibacter congregatus]|uniref:thiamine phosphate synthase n=1 Tax=Paremcibacter congregatus TaxID=2043170 RepID=UPI0030EB8F3C|tara:strand:+ start:5039 stop:5665 length:627 start_codon:yes stop_codon:yes gene_type:complete
MADTQLYLITPPAFDPLAFAESLEAALDAGPVASVQLRLKDATDEQVIEAAAILMPLCHAREVAFIINDRPDLAKKIGADGVHIGQGDMSYAEARTIIGDDGVIGVTCKDSRHLSMVAAEQGANYVAFGAFFPTETKADTTPANKDILSWWVELFEIPCVAIGGITVENADELIKAGADFLAVSSGVWNHPQGPRVAVQQFTRLIEEN